MYKYFLGITSFISNLLLPSNKRQWNWVKKNITDHNKLSEYLIKRFKHKGSEVWNDGIRPEVAEALRPPRRIVCIDYAEYVYHLLRNHRYQCYILGMWDGRDYTQGHAICLFAKGSTIGFFSNANCHIGYSSEFQIWDHYRKKYSHFEVIKGRGFDA